MLIKSTCWSKRVLFFVLLWKYFLRAIPCGTRLSLLVVEVREEKRKFGWPALLLIRNSYGMSAGDIQVCGTSRRSIRWLLLAQDRAALLGILVLSAFPLHSNPAIYTVKSIKSRKHDSLGWHAEADIFFVLKTEEAECACSLLVTDFTYSPAWKEEHSGEKPEPVLNNCREIWLGLFITSSKWYKDFIPMSCEDGWIKGPEMKGKKERDLTLWSRAEAVKVGTRIKNVYLLMSNYCLPTPTSQSLSLCPKNEWC